MRPHRPRPLVLVLALLVAAPLAARGADTPTEVGELRSALAARVSAIGSDPADRALAKEAKKLAKANDAAAAYRGVDDLADLVALGKVAKQIAKSRTADTAVRDELDDLFGCLGEVVAARSTEARQALDTLTSSAYRAKLQSVLDKAGAKLADAEDLVTDDPIKAHAGLRKAWTLYEKAIAKGERFSEKEASGGGSPGGKLPNGLTVNVSGLGFYLRNDSTTRYYIQDVIFDGVIRNASGTVVGSPDGLSARTVAPERFRITNFPDGSFDAPNLVERRFPDFPSAPLYDLGQFVDLLGSQVPFVLEAHTFEGTMRVVLAKKKSGGGTLYRADIPLSPSGPFFPFDTSGF